MLYEYLYPLPVTAFAVFFFSKIAGEFGAERFVISILLNLLSFVSIVDPPKEDIQKAMFSNFSDIEDAIQVQTALTFKMDYFLTSDKKLIKSSSEFLPILTANEFLKRVSIN